MALVPFHMWAPDTYEGSPSVVSALLAAGSKKMGFVAAFRVLILALVAIRVDIQYTFAILAIITMTYGNVVAISQRSIKRMLAYSSIAQAGYISLAFVVMTPDVNRRRRSSCAWPCPHERQAHSLQWQLSDIWF